MNMSDLFHNAGTWSEADISRAQDISRDRKSDVLYIMDT